MGLRGATRTRRGPVRHGVGAWPRSCVCLSVLMAPTGTACLIDGSIGRADTGSGSDTASADAEVSAASHSASGSTDTTMGLDTAGADGTADPDTGATTVQHHADEGTATVGHPSACEIVPEDSECAMCRKTSCCEPLSACHDDAACWCEWGCRLEAQHTASMCLEICGSDGTLLSVLVTCSERGCSGVCGDRLTSGS